VLITDLTPEKSITAAMNEINASRRQRVAALEKAEANKILHVKEAEADAESKYVCDGRCCGGCYCYCYCYARRAPPSHPTLLLLTRKLTHLLSQVPERRRRSAHARGHHQRLPRKYRKHGPGGNQCGGLRAHDGTPKPPRPAHPPPRPRCLTPHRFPQLTTQYFDTLQKFAGEGNAIMIPSGAGAVGDMSAQVRDGMLQGGFLAPPSGNTINRGGRASSGSR